MPNRQISGSSPLGTLRALKNGDLAASALAEHVLMYKVDLSKVTVIDTHPHTQTLCIC